jgi:hypothetical protein
MIARLLDLAKSLRDAGRHDEELGLSAEGATQLVLRQAELSTEYGA